MNCPIKKMRLAKAGYHHGDLRNALVNEALRLLEKDGSTGFTLRDLGKRVGVSYAAPYSHFEDKRALLAAVAAVGCDQLTAALQTAIKDKTDPTEEFLSMGLAYVQFGLDHPSLYRLMFTAWELTPEDKEKYAELNEASERAFKTLTDMLERLKQSGFIRPGMLEADGLAVWANVHGIASLAIDGRIDCACDEVPPIPEVVRYCLMSMLNGLKQPAS
jgi:AcrR family transcriptional regulator